MNPVDLVRNDFEVILPVQQDQVRHPLHCFKVVIGVVVEAHVLDGGGVDLLYANVFGVLVASLLVDLVRVDFVLDLVDLFYLIRFHHVFELFNFTFLRISQEVAV